MKLKRFSFFEILIVIFRFLVIWCKLKFCLEWKHIIKDNKKEEICIFDIDMNI